MTIAVVWKDGTRTSVPIPPAWFMPDFAVTTNMPTVCKRIIGHSTGTNRVLLWIVRNDRPLGPQLSLLLLDTVGKRVLDLKNDLGELPWNGAMIVKRASGASVMLDRESTQDAITFGEFGIPEWMDIKIQNDRVIAGWRDGTEKKSKTSN